MERRLRSGGRWWLQSVIRERIISPMLPISAAAWPLPSFLGCYAIAALTSYYIRWVFGRLDGLALPMVAQMIVLRAFPAGIGAAIARPVV